MSNPLYPVPLPPLAGLEAGGLRRLATRLRPLVLGTGSLLLLSGAGLAHGARLAIGTEGVLALAEAADPFDLPHTQRLERDPLQGSWWVPEGSSARRPRLRLVPRAWQPRRPR